MSSSEAPSTILLTRPGPVCPPPCLCTLATLVSLCLPHLPLLRPPQSPSAPQPSSLCPVNTHSFFGSQLPALPQRIFPDDPSHPVLGSHGSVLLPLIKLTPLICVIMDYGLPPTLDCRAMGVGLWLELPVDPGREPAHGRGSRNSC